MLDLWAEDIAETVIKTPVAILKEQASLLGKKTQNIVVGEVISTQAQSEKIRHRFNVVAPALGNYSFELFSISHNMDLYPLEISIDEKIYTELSSGETAISKLIDQQKKKSWHTVSADSEDMLVEFLGGILKSNRTKHVVQALLAQSTQYAEPNTVAANAA